MRSNFFAHTITRPWFAGVLTIATGLGCFHPAIAHTSDRTTNTASVQSRLSLATFPQRLSQALPDDLLLLDDSGDRVAELQTRLADLGYFDGPITGYFGPLTEASVIAFQQDQGLNADGIVGASTWSALQRAGAPSGDSSDNLLMLGDTGPAVSNLQGRLRDLGFYQGAVDGVFGAETESAVLALQRARGLTPDGIAGPATLGTLNQSVAANPTPQPPPSQPNTSGSPSGFPQPSSPAPVSGQPQDVAPTTPVAPVAQLPPPDMEGPYSVLDLQWKLRQQGFYNGPLDGVMGPEVQRSIREAQMEYNLDDSDFRY